MIACPSLPVHASKRGGELYVHIEKGRIALAGYAALYAESDLKLETATALSIFSKLAYAAVNNVISTQFR